jgi:hypothetical protein
MAEDAGHRHSTLKFSGDNVASRNVLPAAWRKAQGLEVSGDKVAEVLTARPGGNQGSLRRRRSVPSGLQFPRRTATARGEGTRRARPGGARPTPARGEGTRRGRRPGQVYPLGTSSGAGSLWSRPGRDAGPQPFMEDTAPDQASDDGPRGGAGRSEAIAA